MNFAVVSVSRKRCDIEGRTPAGWHRDCYFERMMTVMLILLGLIAVGLIAELIAVARAPLGYQDESGFHFGRESAAGAEKSGCENPS